MLSCPASAHYRSAFAGLLLRRYVIEISMYQFLRKGRLVPGTDTNFSDDALLGCHEASVSDTTRTINLCCQSSRHVF